METSQSEKHLKTWGYELWIANKEEYCGKLLYFRAGQGCSLHYHLLKDETFYCHSGRFGIRLRDKNGVDSVIPLLPGDSLHIPRGQMHQIVSGMESDSELFEFSTQHFEEDSYRVEKFDGWIVDKTVGVTKRPRSKEVVDEFSEFCHTHPDLPFWQTVTEFSGYDRLYGRHGEKVDDLFLRLGK